MATNLLAEKEGVFIGQALADARALCPTLETAKATPELDHISLERLAFWCMRYSPLVRVQAPDGIALDITGCAHLFGGEPDMMQELSSRLNRFGLTVRIGLADTIGGAWAAARFGEDQLNRVRPGEMGDFLAPLTIAALDLPANIQEQLEQLGLHRIGQLIETPSAPLMARFGCSLPERLDRALGRAADVFEPLVLPTEYHAECSLMEPVTYVEGVQTCLQKLGGHLQHLLKSEYKGARAFELRLFRVDGHVQRLAAASRTLCDDAEYIQLLFKEALVRLQTDVDLGYGIDFISLSAFFVEERASEQRGWGDETHAKDQTVAINRLLDRFGNRLGFEQITRSIPEDSHIPERSHREVPVHIDTGKTSFWMGKKSISQERPLLLFRPPEPVSVLAEVPDGPPVRFEWRRRLHHITRAEGPERIAPEWWRLEGRTSQQTRDYYRVEDRRGHRFWLYRDGLYERENDKPCWFVQGVFS